jgi:hypothetical protein
VSTGAIPYQLRLSPDMPQMLDLPWHVPLKAWRNATPRFVEVQAGNSRHTVIFVSYEEAVFALKELPIAAAEKEYRNLQWLESRKLPAVRPAGLALPPGPAAKEEGAILISRFLDHSLPYLHLFRQADAVHSQDVLLDSLVSLLVQLHLQKFYWGDCSLSNVLFRRDAGRLQSHLVDAETAEAHDTLSDALRLHDLDIASENLAGELLDLQAQGAVDAGIRPELFVGDLGRRYERLWSELNEAVYIQPGGAFRIEGRIRRLNEMGFSIGEIFLNPTEQGDRLQFKVAVTDRQYHRNLLFSLVGLTAGEEQARTLLNDLAQYKAVLVSRFNRSIPQSVAAFHWLEECFLPVQRILGENLKAAFDAIEGYCDVLVHKWFLSEKAGQDVGLIAAAASYAKTVTRDPQASPGAP